MKVKNLKLQVQSYPPSEIITPPTPSYLKRGCRRQGRYFKGRMEGFTLIEVVMIIVVVSIAIPTLLIVLGQGAKQGVDAELLVSATNVAQAQMEATLSLGFSGIASTAYSTTVGGNTYSGNVTVCYVQAAALNTCVTPPPTTDYKRISVTVTSPTQAGLVTVVTNY